VALVALAALSDKELPLQSVSVFPEGPQRTPVTSTPSFSVGA
jgi:hypothetical protein